MKKAFFHIVNAVSVLIIALALFVLLSVVLTRSGETPSIMGYSVFRVISGSMEPAIGENDLIVVKRVEPEEVRTGDVISFYASDPSLRGAVNTHRVTAVSQENGETVFTTKGDANQLEDAYPVYPDALIGRVVFVSAFLGTLSRLVSNPLIFVPLIFVPLLAILLANMVRTVRLAKAAAQEEERQALAELVEQAKRRRAENEQNEPAAPDAPADEQEPRT